MLRKDARTKEISLFTIYYLLFTIHYSLFTIHSLPRTVSEACPERSRRAEPPVPRTVSEAEPPLPNLL